MQYSVDSIPIIFHPVWQYNFGHTLMSSMSWVYNNLNQSTNVELAQQARCGFSCSACRHSVQPTPDHAAPPSIQAGHSNAPRLGHGILYEAAAAALAAPPADDVC